MQAGNYRASAEVIFLGQGARAVRRSSPSRPRFLPFLPACRRHSCDRRGVWRKLVIGAISVNASRRDATSSEGHQVRVGQLDRHSAPASSGDDAHKHYDPVPRVEKALDFKAPLGPCTPKHGGHLRESLSPLEDRLALWVAAGKLK